MLHPHPVLVQVNVLYCHQPMQANKKIIRKWRGCLPACNWSFYLIIHSKNCGESWIRTNADKSHSSYICFTLPIPVTPINCRALWPTELSPQTPAKAGKQHQQTKKCHLHQSNPRDSDRIRTCGPVPLLRPLYRSATESKFPKCRHLSGW